MLEGSYKIYYNKIISVLDEKRVFTSKAETLAYGTDASFYRLIPKIVIQSKSIDEVQFLLEQAHALKLAVTFRAAGTSLSGQAISDSILILTSKFWTEHEVLDNGLKIRLEPGIIGARANAILKPFGRKIGPDPASINSARIGGIAANNASGMCCGTSQNSYQTLDSMRIIFYDGTLLDTSNKQSVEAFKNKHSYIYNSINKLAKEIKNKPDLEARIRHKFKMKNTTGYSLNALIDYTDPIDIIGHLMIGSEGTLGMIADITYHTVEDLPFKASSLMIFKNIELACKVVSKLKNTKVDAVELMDRASLKSVENMEGVPFYLKTLSEKASAVLVETRALSVLELKENIAQIKETISDIASELPIEFTDQITQYMQFWKIRKGLFPTIGAIRKIGTSVIIEDVTFPVEQLAEATLDLQALFKKYSYTEAVIFGHALEGNLHFVFTQDFSEEKEVIRYDKFMVELANLVVDKYDGALKAEHGTGRNMAPFVEKEWGKEAYGFMLKLKNIFDPQLILNPGVIINSDQKAHLKNLKPLPKADAQIDSCIECGFCESSCVSHDLSFSPRQRIVLHREVSELYRQDKAKQAEELIQEIDYGFDKMCATDGLCALACPVKIDTGDYVKKLRKQKNSGNKVALTLAKNMGIVTKSTELALDFANGFSNIIGNNNMNKIVATATSLFGNPIVWDDNMPKATNFKLPEKKQVNGGLKMVYFSSCINRSMGTSNNNQDKESVFFKTNKLLNKANCEIIYPENIEKQCCGMAYSSQGFSKAGEEALNRLKKSLNKASNNGEYPILCDMSPCLYTMKEALESTGLKLYDITEFTLKHLVNHLDFKAVDQEIAVFSVCSLKKMGLEESFYKLANLCATKVQPIDANCCGFAGNRGFNYPELNQHGLANLKKQLPEKVQKGFASSRTCEIGLSKHSGIDFQSIVNLIDKATSPKKN